MPHHIAWYIPNKVYYAQIWGKTDGRDIAPVAAALEELLQPSIPYNIHGIVDLSHNTPENLNFIDIVKEIRKIQHLTRHFAWTLVVVDQNAPTNKIIATAAKLMNFQIRFFDRTEEALAFLNTQDTSLPPLRALLAAYRAKHFPPELLANEKESSHAPTN